MDELKLAGEMELGEIEGSGESGVSEYLIRMAEDDEERAILIAGRRLRDIQAQMAQYERQRAAYNGEVDRTLIPLREMERVYREAMLDFVSTAKDPKKNSYVIPGLGKVQFRTYQRDVRVVDQEAAVKWFTEHEMQHLIRVKREVVAADAKPVAKQSYESADFLIPGFEVVEARTTETITWDEGVE